MQLVTMAIQSHLMILQWKFKHQSSGQLQMFSTYHCSELHVMIFLKVMQRSLTHYVILYLQRKVMHIINNIMHKLLELEQSNYG